MAPQSHSSALAIQDPAQGRVPHSPTPTLSTHQSQPAVAPHSPSSPTTHCGANRSRADGTGTGTRPIPAGCGCGWPRGCLALGLAPCRPLGIRLPPAPHSLCGTPQPSPAKTSSALRPGQGAAPRPCLSRYSPAFGLCSWGGRETHKNL